MRRLIPQNDHVRNKDRQDPMAVVAIIKTEIINYLETLGPVSHTLIPEKLRYTEANKPGMYHNPVSVTIGKFGTFMFLSKTQEKCTLFRARLHYPVEKVDKIKELEIKGNHITFVEGISSVNWKVLRHQLSPLLLPPLCNIRGTCLGNNQRRDYEKIGNDLTSMVFDSE